MTARSTAASHRTLQKDTEQRDEKRPPLKAEKPMQAGARKYPAAAAVFCRWWFLCKRPQGTLHRARNSGVANRDECGTAAAAEYRPHQGSMAYHDP